MKRVEETGKANKQTTTDEECGRTEKERRGRDSERERDKERGGDRRRASEIEMDERRDKMKHNTNGER